MTSTLAQQLLRLAMPQTAMLALNLDKQRPSLLFEPKEAANFEIDTVYCLGLNGLEELEMLDAAFAEFEETLFHESSKSFVRSIEDHRTNRKVDDTVADFLHRVSPFALLRAAHKAIEWLVCRFHVHLYNRDALIACFLPYHSTNIFVRVVQLLDLRNESDRWHWLLHVQKSGFPLTKLAIHKRCTRDLGFMRFVCESTDQFFKETDTPVKRVARWQTLLSFYCTTVVGAIHHADAVSEKMLMLLVPYVLRGLQSNVETDLVCTSYMVCNQLMAKVKLTDVVTERFVRVIVNSLREECFDEGVTSLSLIYQYQRAEDIPSKCFLRLMRWDNLVDALSSLDERFDLISLGRALLRRAFGFTAYQHPEEWRRNEGDEEWEDRKREVRLESLAFAQKLVSTVTFNSEAVESLIRQLTQLIVDVQAMIGKQKKGFARLQMESLENVRTDQERRNALKTMRRKSEAHEEKIREYAATQGELATLLAAIERRYPDEFDRLLEELLKDYKPTAQSCITSFLNAQLGVKHKLVRGTTIFLNLNHPDARRRSAATAKLMGMKVKKARDVEFTRNALIERLVLDEPVVVNIVLGSPKLLDIIPAETLLETLATLFAKKRTKGRKKWRGTYARAVAILCGRTFLESLSPEKHSRVVLLVAPFILTRASGSTGCLETIAGSRLADEGELLHGLREAGVQSVLAKFDKAEVVALNEDVIGSACRGLLTLPDSKGVDLIEDLVRSSAVSSAVSSAWQSHHQFLSASFLSHAVLAKETGPQLRKMAELALDFCADFLLKHKKLPRKDKVGVGVELGAAPWGPEKRTSVVEFCLQELEKDNACPTEAVLFLLHDLIAAFKLPETLRHELWWLTANGGDPRDCFLGLQAQLFDMVSEQAIQEANFQELLKHFMQTNFSTADHALRLLGMLWTSYEAASDESGVVVSLGCQAKALSVAASLVRNAAADSLDWIFDAGSAVIPQMLVALHSPHKPIRKLALACFEHLKKRRIAHMAYSHLVEHVCLNGDEIVTDAGQLRQALGRLFTDASETLATQVLNALLECIVSVKVPVFVVAKLLGCLTLVISEAVLVKSQTLFSRLLKKTAITRSEGEIVKYLLLRYTPETAASIDSALFELFKASLLSMVSLPGQDMSCQKLALSLVTKDFFVELAAGNQQQLLSMIIDLRVDNTDPMVTSLLMRVLKKISLDASQIVIELKKISNGESSVLTVRKAKRMRLHSTAPVYPDSHEWRRLVPLLEMLQTKKKIKRTELLVPVLFNILKRCLEFEQQEPIEYTKQLALACLYHCCVKLSPEGETISSDVLSDTNVNVELVVQCLRRSSNMQTHDHSLQLLGLIARLFPEHVMHNTVAIFTFMGTNLLRQDDQFSFQILARTIQTIIPAVTNINPSKKKRETEAEKLVVMLLRIFFDAFPDIPAHRRLPVFKQIVEMVDARLYLSSALCLLMERHVASCRTTSRETDVESGRESGRETDAESVTSTRKLATDPSNSAAFKFALELSLQFPPRDQVYACERLVQYLATLPLEKDDKPKPVTRARKQTKNSSGQGDDGLFNVAAHSAKELRHFKFITVTFLASLLGDSAFALQLEELAEGDTKKLKKQYGTLLEECLRFANQAGQASEQFSQRPTAKFWKALVYRIYDVLDKVNALLPAKTFIVVVSGLLANDLMLVRRKAMELLNSRLQSQPEMFQGQDPFLVGLLKPLLVTIKSRSKGETVGSAKEEMAVLKQTALFTLKLVCRLLQPDEHVEVFKQILEAAVRVLKDNVAHTPVCASALLCVVELCNCLRTQSVPYLTQFMPPMMECLQDEERLKRHELFLLSAVSVVHRLLEVLPHFLSPYMTTILRQLCLISTYEINNANALSVRLKAIRHNMATVIPARVLLPAISACYQELLFVSHDALAMLMLIAKDAVKCMESEDRLAFLLPLQDFFLQALDYRVQYPQESPEKVAAVEQSVMEPVVGLVMKMTEATLRPFLFKLFNWATADDSPRDRTITFYYLATQIAERLQSLFVRFAANIVPNAAVVLSQLNAVTGVTFFEDDDDSGAKCCLLLRQVLDCLYKIFLHDNEGFVNQERFDTLMQPLVDQIENVVGGDGEYRKRVTDHLAPCVAQFAVAAADDASWQQLNYQVLLKTRSSSAKIRFAGLQVVQEINKRLEKGYMSLVPETIPFLAELMEDESLEVEQQCQAVIASMELTLGEPLQKYF